MTERTEAHRSHAHALPQPTVWPVVMAAGIALMAAGVVIGIIVFVCGAVLFALATWGWVRDLLAEHGAPEGQGGRGHG